MERELWIWLARARNEVEGTDVGESERILRTAIRLTLATRSHMGKWETILISWMNTRPPWFIICLGHCSRGGGATRSRWGWIFELSWA